MKRIISIFLLNCMLLATFICAAGAGAVYADDGGYVFTYEDLAGMGEFDLAEGEFLKVDKIEGQQTQDNSLLSRLATLSVAFTNESYYMILREDGMLLTNPSGTSFSKTRYNAGGSAHTYQKWLFVDDGNGAYIVCPEHDSSKCLTINTNTLAVTLAPYMGSPYQKWGMYVASNGNALRSEADGTALEGYKLVISDNGCSVSASEYTPMGFFDTSWYIPTVRIGYPAFMVALRETKKVSLNTYPEDAHSLDVWTDWSCSNGNITVSERGYVTGKEGGTTATLNFTDRITGASNSCTVTVLDVAEGTFFIKNRQTGCFAQSANATPATGVRVQQHALNGNDEQKWVLDHLGDGYYSIRFLLYNGGYYYLSVKDDSTAVDHPLEIRKSLKADLTDSMKWKFVATSSGAYKIVPKSGESLGYAVVTDTSAATNGAAVLQGRYVANTSYRDEWYLIQMLPTSGSELEYDETLWDGDTQAVNCYGYAFNIQTFPGTNVIWAMPQPGQYYNAHRTIDEEPFVLDSSSALSVSTAVALDVAKYNELNNTEMVFNELHDKYEICSPGTYRVALVVSDGDYHWYRQDADGLWSHKRGNGPVKRKDSSEILIIDPDIANTLPYTSDPIYFEVTPWNDMYED